MATSLAAHCTLLMALSFRNGHTAEEAVDTNCWAPAASSAGQGRKKD